MTIIISSKNYEKSFTDKEIINMIKSVGYQPILKDWERI